MKFLLFLLVASSFADSVPSNKKLLEIGTILGNTLKLGKCAEDFFRLGECVAPHELIIDQLRDSANEETILNPAIMRKVVDITRNVSTCLGDVTCEDAQLVKYSADSAVFIGELVYGDAFHCLINIDLPETFQTCLKFAYEHKPTDEELETLTPRQTHERTITPMFRCFMAKIETNPTDCTPSRRTDVYQAARALSELIYTYNSYKKNLPTEYEFRPYYLF